MKYLKLILGVSAILACVQFAHSNEYDGTYTFKIINSKGPCSINPGKVTVKNGKIKGELKSEGAVFRVSGKIAEDGTAKGKIIGARGRGVFKGSAAGGNNVGTWSASGGCSGEFVFQ